MGINTKVDLPQDTDLWTLQEAVRNLVPEATVEFKNGYSLGQIDLTIKANENYPLVDGETYHSASVYLQGGDANDKLHIYCGNSTTFWTAFGVALAKTFGGTVDINDCDSSDVDYEFKRAVPKFKSSGMVTPADEAKYEKLQRRVANVKPLKWADLVAVDKKVKKAGGYTLEMIIESQEKNRQYLAQKAAEKKSKSRKSA